MFLSIYLASILLKCSYEMILSIVCHGLIPGVGGLNATLFGTYGLAARFMTGKPHSKDELSYGQTYFAGEEP